MVFAWKDFVPENEGELDSFDPVPQGQYRVMITQSEQKNNSKGTGTILEIFHEIIEGEYKGKRIRNVINLDNPNLTSVEIGRKQLADLCRKISVTRPQGPQDLLNKVVIVDTDVESYKDSNGNEKFSNRVKSYIESSGTVTPPPATNNASTPAPASTTKKKPWEK